MILYHLSLSIINHLIIYGKAFLPATVGLRFDYEHAKKDYKRYTIATGSTSANNSPYHIQQQSRFNQFSPKFSLQYLTTLHNNYYVTVSRGYKVGGFNETITSDDNKTYQPEYSWNYEVGSKRVSLTEKSPPTFLYVIEHQTGHSTYIVDKATS